jgi:hypothetical protein
MRNVSDQAAIESILKAIAQDDELINQFAKVVGVRKDVFDRWIDKVQVPEPLPEKLFVTCRHGEDAELNPVNIFYAAHTTMDRAQDQVDRLTMKLGPLGFIIVDAPLNP